jgi:tetratricopeptide (TPR) repeat protein
MNIFFCSAIMIVIYFVINSSLVSIAISWSIKERFFKYWAKTCLPLAIVDFPPSAAVAIGMAVTSHFQWWYHLACAPLIVLGWGYNRMRKNRILDTENHLKELEQLYITAEAYRYIGIAEETSEPEKVLDNYLKALSLDPTNEEIQFWIARTYVSLGNEAKASEILNKLGENWKEYWRRLTNK